MFCSTHDLLEMEVELIEDKVIEDQTIDIDSIEELDEEIAYTNIDLATTWNEPEKRIVKQQNKIIQAVKHLNKEIQSIKKGI